jgi:hypothetical protein
MKIQVIKKAEKKQASAIDCPFVVEALPEPRK